jgi:penicillin amidase
VNALRLALRLLGRRLPVTSGALAVEGASDEITIRRDRFGIPHISVRDDADAWFGLGFCQGQDRSFQLEVRLRLVRGTLAALLGPDVVALDRMSRRIGFRRHGEQAAAALSDRHRSLAEAFAAGVTAGATVGQPRRPHEFALLRSHPTPYEAADALALLAVQCFALASNWDTELARLRILASDGADALADLEPGYPSDKPVSIDPGVAAGPLPDAVGGDLGLFLRMVGGIGGGSNNWAISGDRTASGRPILANDPHLAPLLPAHWYLAHLDTPEWQMVGASLPGTPAFGAGHNGSGAFGVTAGLIDNTDLFIEEIGPDGASVRRGERFVPCEVERSTIEVRGGDDEEITVLRTDRGPIVGDSLGEHGVDLSLSATWLEPEGHGAIFEIGRIGSYEELRDTFREWRSLPLNVAYADEDGHIGWQLVGAAPIRRVGQGTLPLPASDPATGWDGMVPFDDLPWVRDPAIGFVATANNQPASDSPWLGADFLDGYRVQRISEVVAARDDWTVPDTLRLQMDRTSIPWRELGPHLLPALEGVDGLERAHHLLAGWDGDMGPGSPAATVFAALVSDLCVIVATERAPRSWRHALGAGYTDLVPFNAFVVRRVSHLAGLLDDPPDWLDAAGAIRTAARRTLARIETTAGPDPGDWAWGAVRPLTIRHPMGLRPPLGRLFDLGPMAHGGDANTINPAPVDPLDPLGNPDFAIASLRFVVEPGDWDRARFVLPAGQSGNPFSPHYADQLPLWQRGDAVVVPMSEEAVRRTTRATLTVGPRT